MSQKKQVLRSAQEDNSENFGAGAFGGRTCHHCGAESRRGSASTSLVEPFQKSRNEGTLASPAQMTEGEAAVDSALARRAAKLLPARERTTNETPECTTGFSADCGVRDDRISMWNSSDNWRRHTRTARRKKGVRVVVRPRVRQQGGRLASEGRARHHRSRS